MSCHSTSGGIVSTSLARAVTGLSEKEVQHIFHALKREAQGMSAPSEMAVQEWRSRQYDLLSRMKRMSDTRRDKMRDRLFRSRSESVPDGATFHAWATIEARARQAAALREVTSAVDLDPPGSQAHLYELGEDGRPSRVWYASYGSNLHRDRFMNYIEGGSPEGSTRTYTGCSDPTPPSDDIPIRFAGARPHFALTSRVWRGGIAFIDAQKGESAQGLGRAYDISISQFDEVVAQENGLPTSAASPVPLEEALTSGRSVIGNGTYETILHIGDYQGAPVLTFTAPFSTREALTKTGHIVRQANPQTTPVRMPVMTNKPSPAYLRMIGGGLGETFGMSEVQQADYLRGCPGGDRWSRQQMVRILRGEDPDPPREAGPESATSTSSGAQANQPKAGGSGKRGKGAKGRTPVPAQGDDGSTLPFIVTKSSTEDQPRRTNRPTNPAFSHADSGSSGTSRLAEEGSVLEDLRSQGLFPDDSLQPRRNARNPRGRTGESSGPRAGSAGKKEPSPGSVRTRRRDGVRELPRVKKYPSVEEQRKGVIRWTSTVNQQTAVRDSIEKSVNGLSNGLKKLDPVKDKASVYATRRNLEDAKARLDEANRMVTQAQQRLSEAKGQTPSRYFSPGARSLDDWKTLADSCIAGGRSTEAALDARKRRLAELRADPSAREDALARAQREVTRLQQVVTSYEEQFTEVEQIIRSAAAKTRKK